jgi:hypothetical protein
VVHLFCERFIFLLLPVWFLRKLSELAQNKVLGHRFMLFFVWAYVKEKKKLMVTEKNSSLIHGLQEALFGF